MRLKAIHQILIAAAVAVLIFILFFLFVLRPQLGALGGLREEVRTKEEEIRTAEDTLKRLEDYKREMAGIEIKLQEIDKRMPKEPQLSSLIREIQRIANEAGVEFVSIKPSTLSQQPEYAEVPMEIVIDGYFGEVVDFLYRVQNEVTREIKVTSVTITEGEKNLPNIKVTIKASAFVLQKGPSATKGGKPSGTQQQPSGTQTPSGGGGTSGGTSSSSGSSSSTGTSSGE